jgi:hypothetical protein
MRFIASLVLFAAVAVGVGASDPPPPNPIIPNPNPDPPVSWSGFSAPNFVNYTDELIFIEAYGFYAGANANTFTAGLMVKNVAGEWEPAGLWTAPISPGYFTAHMAALPLPAGQYVLIGSFSATHFYFDVVDRPEPWNATGR